MILVIDKMTWAPRPASAGRRALQAISQDPQTENDHHHCDDKDDDDDENAIHINTIEDQLKMRMKIMTYEDDNQDINS